MLSGDSVGRMLAHDGGEGCWEGRLTRQVLLDKFPSGRGILFGEAYGWVYTVLIG